MTQATDALARVVARKAGGEARPGQKEMCAAVEAALGGAGHLLVEAPTGTGKSLAYLVPAVLHARSAPDRRVVVVTATRALQEQLVHEDLPFLATALAPDGVRFDFAMLKGRSNYLCRAKLAVALEDGLELRLDFERGGRDAARATVQALAAWTGETATGDRAEAPAVATDAVWSQVSVDRGECPGAAHCRFGDDCFAETARDRAGAADIVVANAHLYASHLAAEGGVLPEHDTVVVDEAHTLENTVSSVLGLHLSGGRLRRLASRLRGAGGGGGAAEAVEVAATALDAVLAARAAAADDDGRVVAHEGDLAVALTQVATAAAAATAELRDHTAENDTQRDKAAHAVRLAGGVREDAARLLDAERSANHVAWVQAGPGPGSHELVLAAVDVGPVLADILYPVVTVVATSATLAAAGRFDLLAGRLGLDCPRPASPGDGGTDGTAAGAATYRALQVASPFDHRRQALLYVARHLPDPRQAGHAAAMHAELHRLGRAAGGRTLALFTSRLAMRQAAEALRDRGGLEVLVQDEVPRALLLERFRAGGGSVLCATQSFWSGIDLPGRLCHLVTIDRIPFPRPTDPLHRARRDAARARRQDPFNTVDLPAAAIQLAQGVGRLIRSTTDEGVVAVFDRRLALSGYRQVLLATMPRFRRSVDPAEASAVLERLAADAAGPGRGGGT